MPVTETTSEMHDLAERFQSGDPEAFRRLHALVNRDVTAFVLARCPRDVDGEGLVQDVWIKAWSNRESYSNQHFRGWIFQIARNLLTDAFRKAGRRPKREDWDERDFIEAIQDRHAERIAALKECLESGGGEFVSVLRMQLDGLDSAAIAERLDIAEGTVHSRASRGRDQVKICMEQKLQ